MRRIFARSAPLVLASLLLGLTVLPSCGESTPMATVANAPPAQAPWFDNFDSVGDQFVFVNLVEAYFLKRGQRVALRDDGYFWAQNARGESWDGADLSRICARVERDAWEEAIETYFDAKFRQQEQAAQIQVPDWAAAQRKLFVKLYPKEFLQVGVDPETFVHRFDLPGVASCIVYDHEYSLVVLQMKDVERWRMQPAEVFAVAEANTRQQLRASIEIQTLEDTDEFKAAGDAAAVPAQLLSSISDLTLLQTKESRFASSIVLWLRDGDRFLDGLTQVIGKHGTIFAIPGRSGAVAYPFDDSSIETVAPALLVCAQKLLKQDAKGPISTELFWWHPEDDRYRTITITLEDGSPRIAAPEELTTLLKELNK